uniref:Uncharacterized protein n=1 Tax=Ditylenchus dipsaci TaxID=166011 RepID=A0A915E968_9BILA
MMRMWGNSKTAKYLMPMLSADTRLAVMHKIQEEAKENGIELPPIFEDIDQKTGMPKILALSQENRDPEKQSALFDEMIRQNDAFALASIDQMESTSARPAAPASVVFYESDAQTDRIFSEDKNDQTAAVEVVELGIQAEQLKLVEFTDLAMQTTTPEFCEFGVQAEEALPKQVSVNILDIEFVDEGIQTDLSPSSESPSLMEQEIQTKPIDFSNAETMTSTSTFTSLDVQTDQVRSMDQQLQTHLIDVLENEMQTDQPETKNQRVQTLHPELCEGESQTDEIELSAEEKERLSKITKARRRLRRAFQNHSSTDSAKRRVSHGDTPTMSRWQDLPEEEEGLEHLSESSYESLNWDPIDGLHAEKQRAVKDLKKMFDRNRPLRTSSKKKERKPQKPQPQ